MREVKYKNSLVASAFYTQKGAFYTQIIRKIGKYDRIHKY